MKSPLLDLALSAVRGWTRLYTWRMPPRLREARRAEIESDLWEFRQDSTGARDLGQAAHVLVRLLRGVPADLVWRREQTVAGEPSLRRNVALTATALLVLVLWMFTSLRPPELPLPRVAPTPLVDVSLPKPPPPPPPPPGCRAPAWSGCS